MNKVNGKRALETLIRLTAARENLAVNITIKEREVPHGQTNL